MHDERDNWRPTLSESEEEEEEEVSLLPERGGGLPLARESLARGSCGLSITTVGWRPGLHQCMTEPEGCPAAKLHTSLQTTPGTAGPFFC